MISPNRALALYLSFLISPGFSQGPHPHLNAHAHNDYEHARPLLDALQNGFTSVEADVHLRDGNLVVAHNHDNNQSPSLEKLYLRPLDSILNKNHGQIYQMVGSSVPFYLMIDIKTEADAAVRSLRILLKKYPALSTSSRPVRIFLSGNRSTGMMIAEPDAVLAIDGRPTDLGKGYSSVQMPVISDHFRNWSHWNGKSPPEEQDISKIRDLALRVHAEGKKLRLWAIPDNELAWGTLLNAGVDFINTDRLVELNGFLTRNGL